MQLYLKATVNVAYCSGVSHYQGDYNVMQCNELLLMNDNPCNYSVTLQTYNVQWAYSASLYKLCLV